MRILCHDMSVLAQDWPAIERRLENQMSSLEQLSGKVAVVTGGASGIGKGIARRLVAQGMRVVIADVERTVLERTAAEIGAAAVLTDVSSRESVQALADEVLRRFGAIDVVCNNAGVGSVARIAEMKPPDWTWLLSVNLWGVVHGIEVFLPILSRNEGGGHIVNTASMGGLSTLPTLGGYCATKFAVVGLSETLAQELAESGSKVGVTILCPGPVRSNLKASMRNRPASLAEGGLVDSDLEASEIGAQVRWLEPDEVGDIVVRAIRRGDLYALTHPEMKSVVTDRHRRIEEAFDAAAAN
jgi:NAD(P)-dependent dehydrogenase (short-subunit alcohol dehydrogenase family)